MKSGNDQKSFDVMKWLRETRDRIYEETKHMTPEEELAWYSRRPTDPVLARLFDRRKAPGGDRKALDEGVDGRGEAFRPRGEKPRE